MAVRRPGHQRAQADPIRHRGQCGEQRPRLQARALGIAVEGGEVVEDPGRLEAGLLGPHHAVTQLGPVELVLGNVDADLHGRHRNRTGQSLLLNRLTAMAKTPRPSPARITSWRAKGTAQPFHVTPGSRIRVASGVRLRWEKTTWRMGSTA